MERNAYRQLNSVTQVMSAECVVVCAWRCRGGLCGIERPTAMCVRSEEIESNRERLCVYLDSRCHI